MLGLCPVSPLHNRYSAMHIPSWPGFSILLVYYVVLDLAAANLAVADFKLEPLPSISLLSKQASKHSTWELNQASALTHAHIKQPTVCWLEAKRGYAAASAVIGDSAPSALTFVPKERQQGPPSLFVVSPDPLADILRPFLR